MTSNKTIMPRLLERKGKKKATYYYTGVRPPINLGHDRHQAMREYLNLESGQDSTPRTFKAVAAKYMRDILPEKKPATQRVNQLELERLLPVFGHMNLSAIQPHHIKRYVKGRSARIRANREKALFSHIFNYAREYGYTSAPNPCIGIKGNKETGRKRYVTNDEYATVWEASNPMLQDVLDLLLITGQRPADVLKMRRSDISEGVLWVDQNKTGAKLGIEITAHLQAILNRRKGVQSLYLISDKNGQQVPYSMLRSWFRKARKVSGVDFQMRDLRAKSATDLEDLGRAKALLGHTKIGMTEHYVKNRRGDKVRPLK